jgi:ABC-type nitrate/sulfonate/bicarbonate transport system permease component
MILGFILATVLGYCLGRLHGIFRLEMAALREEAERD